MQIVVMLLAAALAVWLFVRLIVAPIRWIWKILLNVFCGWGCLIALNFIGSFVGFHLGMTVWSALIVGALGIPGLVLLGALQWLL